MDGAISLEYMQHRWRLLKSSFELTRFVHFYSDPFSLIEFLIGHLGKFKNDTYFRIARL